MPYVRRLPSGLWQATVRHPSGRRLTRTDPLKRAVTEWAAEQERAISRGVWRDPRAGRITVEAWQQRWWAARVVEDETRRGDLTVLNTHLIPHWGTWPLAKIRRLDVQSWVRGMEQAGVGRSAIRRAYNLLSRMLADAVLEDMLAESPCRGIVLPATPPKTPAWFTRQQAARIVAALSEPHRTMTELMLWTGLRWGEAAGITTANVDWLRGRLTVAGSVTQFGKIKPYPKSSKSRREVPVPRHVLDAMSALVEGRDGELVFVTPRQHRTLSGANWRREWYAVIDALNANARKDKDPIPRWSPHTCRHTAASWLVQDGVPLYDVQRLLGHESFQTTMRYAHLAPDAHGAVESAWRRELVTHQKRMAAGEIGSDGV
jgi:integrase